MKAICLTTIAIIVACLICALDTIAADPAANVANGEARPGERSDVSPDLVSLELWLVTLSDVSDAESERQISPLLARVGNLPTVVGRREDVRALIGRLEERKAIDKIQNFRLTTLSGHEASAVAGERKPRVTGAAINQFGRTNTVTYQQVGTAIHVTPHTGRDGPIRVYIKFETSDLADTRDVALTAPEKGESTYAPTVRSNHLDTVTSVENGAAVLISRTLDSAKRAAQLAILSAEIVEPARVADDAR